MYNTNELLLLGQNIPDEKKLKEQKVMLLQKMMLLICGILVEQKDSPKGVMLTSRNIVNDGYYIGKT